MAGRYSGPVRFFYLGDESVARQYNGIARKLVAYLQNQSELVRDNLWTASRRVKISDGVIIEVLKVTDLIYNAYIDARGVERDEQITDAFTYQFAYTGDGDQLWDIKNALIGGQLFPWAGGIFLATIFVFRENTTDYGVFPILSTREEIQAEDGRWEYVPNLGEIPFEDLIGKLPIPRHEILLASSEHLRLPDKRNMAHVSWMPKGNRHYMASALSVAAIRELGGYQNVVSSGSVLSRQSTTIGGKATDIGYEASLDLYEPAQFVENQLVKGTARRSAPNSDWYTSYGYQKVTHPIHGEREFGIMIDASQRVWVWPLEASEDPWAVDAGMHPYNEWAAHSIKINVDPFFSRDELLTFPPDVIAFPGDQFRTTAGTTFENLPGGSAFHGSPLADLVRYVWHPSPDGKKYTTIVEQVVDTQKPHLFRQGQPLVELALEELKCKVVDDENSPEYNLRFERPVPAQFEITIELTGPEFFNFGISVSPVELVEVADNFYPIQSRFAAEESFAGVAKGELLVAGFDLYTKAPLADLPPSDLVQHIENQGSLGSLYSTRNIKFLTALTHHSTNPVLESFAYKQLTYDPEALTERRCRYLNGQRYRYGDLTYSKLDQSWGRTGDSLAESMVQDLQWNFVMEGAFVVQKLSGDRVFRKTIRKYLDNPLEMGNWFTAQVSNLDVSTGSMVFGLCESTTYYTGVDGDIPYEQVGVANNPAQTPIYLPDTTEQSGVNTTKKGHACYWKGEIVDSRFQPGLSLSRLDEDLDSSPMDLNVRFWGSVYSAGGFVISPTTSILRAQYIYNTKLALLVGEENPEQTDLGLDMAEGYVGIPDFPWGLEMGSWFFNNHFNQANADKILSDDVFFSYFGRYITLSGPLVTKGKSNELAEPSPVPADEVIDVVRVRELQITHAQLASEAFGIPINSARKLSLFEDVGAYSYYRGAFSGATVVFEEEVQVSSIVASMELGGEADFFRVDLECPQFRVYCGINSYPAFYFLGDGYTSVTPRERSTALWANVQSRAYGYTILNEDEENDD